MKNLILPLILFQVFVIACIAQSGKDDLTLSNKIPEISEKQILKTPGYYNWGASICKDENGLYHLFYFRWKKEYSFYGWLTHSEIAHAISKHPAGPWEYKQTELQGRGKGHWDAITAHNPKIKYFDGKYYLYYISTNLGDRDFSQAELVETAQTGYDHSNWKTLRPNQRTGVAVSHSIYGPWKRMDQPLVEPSGPITTLTVNPAIDQGKDGKYYLVVKSDKPNEINFVRNQAIAISDSPTGPFRMHEKPVIDYMDTEDMSVWYDELRQRFYGVFHAHTFIGLITSPGGLNWEKAHDYTVTTKNIRMEDGTVWKPGRLERPFIYAENGKPVVLSLAARDGDDAYTVSIPFELHNNK